MADIATQKLWPTSEKWGGQFVYFDFTVLMWLFLWLMDFCWGLTRQILHYKGTTGSSNVFLLVSKWRGLKRDSHVHTPPSLSETRKDTFNDFPSKIQAGLSSTSVLSSHAWVALVKSTSRARTCMIFRIHSSTSVRCSSQFSSSVRKKSVCLPLKKYIKMSFKVIACTSLLVNLLIRNPHRNIARYWERCICYLKFLS